MSGTNMVKMRPSERNIRPDDNSNPKTDVIEAVGYGAIELTSWMFWKCMPRGASISTSDRRLDIHRNTQALIIDTNGDG